MRRQLNIIKLNEYIKVLESLGYSFSRQKGSHMKFKKLGENSIEVVAENNIKAVYIKQLYNVEYKIYL